MLDGFTVADTLVIKAQVQVIKCVLLSLLSNGPIVIPSEYLSISVTLVCKSVVGCLLEVVGVVKFESLQKICS